MKLTKNFSLILLFAYTLVPQQLFSNNLGNITAQNTILQETDNDPENHVQYNINEQKFQKMLESGRTSVASSYKELQEMLAAAHDLEIIPGVRGDLYIAMYDSWGDGWNGNWLSIGDEQFTIENGEFAEATLTLEDGTYPVVCDGGSWQSEVSWEIYDANSNDLLLSGGAPYSGELVVGGDPPPVPDNDDCNDAELVSGPAPVTLTGTTIGATIDCPGLLNWNAVWYEIPISSDPTDLEITIESSQSINTAGIIIIDGCNCDEESITIGDSELNGNTIELFFENASASTGSILFPLMIQPQSDFEVTFDFESTGPPSTDFSTTIIATDDLGSLPFELTFGTSPDATVGYDDGLDVFAPPPPPPPAWDAALFNMEINDRFFADYRPTTPDGGITEWAVDFQAEQGSDEYILNWEPESLGAGNFVLSDAFGGVAFSIDMRELDSYSVPVVYNRVIITHSYISLDFQTHITATNEFSSGEFVMTIGTSPDATAGYDDGLDVFAPPAPPPPAWDAALFNLEINDRFYADYRETTPLEGSTTWAIDLMVETPNSVNTLSWDPNTLGEGNFMLTDAFGGALFSYDMTTMESVNLDPTINRVLIVHSYYSFDFLTVLSATDNLGSEPFVMSIGTIQNATDGYDEGLDVFAPPAPPPPAWDAALFNQIVNDRFYVDIRPTTPEQGSTEWAVDFQGETGTTDYILSWDPNTLGEGNFTLTDAFGGSLLSINMNEVNQAEIPAAFNRVLITQSLFTLDFAVNLTATDNVNFPIDLIFGTSPDASEGYDAGMDVYAPPAPPPPAWDAALFNTIVSDRFYVDIRPTTPEDGFTEWAVDFQGGIGTEEINLSWNIDALGDGNFTLTDAFGGLFFSVNMSSTNNYSFPITFTRVFIRHSYSSTLEISYMSGWNMVGLPLMVEDNNWNVIFPSGEPNTLYAYDNGYSLETTLDLGVGYLLRMTEENTTAISGTPINSVSISLNENWNIISGISSPVDVEILYEEDIVVPTTAYGYGSNGYFSPDAIEPGYGYWVRAYSEGEITLSGGQRPSGGKSKNHPTIMNRLDFVLADGFSKSLYFGESLTDDEQLQFSLPPKFEGMAFDVRFNGDWSHSEYGSPIQLIGLEEGLVIHYSIPKQSVDEKWVLELDGTQTILGISGEIVPEGVPSTIRLIKASDLPRMFSLGTNFPNPFNGTTIIPFELKETSQISLTVFDVTGKVVTELVSGERPAGFHQIEWDGTNSMGMNMSSGMYIYSLKSGEQKLFKKLLYLK